MAVLYIAEFNELPFTDQGALTGSYGFMSAAPMGPSLVEQTVNIGASRAASSAFNKLTRYVILRRITPALSYSARRRLPLQRICDWQATRSIGSASSLDSELLA